CDDKEDAKEIADRLVQSGYAKPSKSKVEKGRGITTEVGPVVAQSVLDFFASAAGKKILRRIKELGIHPKSEKVSARKAAELPLSGKTLGLLAYTVSNVATVGLDLYICYFSRHRPQYALQNARNCSSSRLARFV